MFAVIGNNNVRLNLDWLMSGKLDDNIFNKLMTFERPLWICWYNFKISCE